MTSAVNFLDILDHHAQTRADRPALHSEGAVLTYAQLWDRIHRFGNVLKALGIRPQDRVVLAFPDSPDSCYAFFGALACGALPALISPDLSRQEYAYILRDCEPSLLVTVGGSAAAAAEPAGPMKRLLLDDGTLPARMADADPVLIRHPAAPEDPAFIQYTSGSTGDPKGIVHTQAGMLFTARHYAGEVLKLSENDVVFSVSKMSFGYGFGNSVIFPLYHGAAAVLYPGRPTPADVLQVLDRYRPTLLFSVPTFYNMLLKIMDGPILLPSLRLCVSAGEALPESTYRSWRELTGLSIVNGVGATEALHIFISQRPGDIRPGASGFPVPGYEVRIVGDDGKPAAEGQQGILQVRGGSTAPCYWNRPEKSAETMLPDGWLRTGDYFIEDKGCYTYQGRQDDLFKVSGAWVAPLKVEEALRTHPAVAECAVTSRRLEGLEKPLAYVVLNAGFTEGMALTRELRSHVLARLPDYMCPVQFNYVQEIPKTSTGKVQKYVLRR
ncbi:MAG: benzoate-CoA ligase family protein [Deltaproteobacteria bacterium]|nr:benzoate-CoA ligase family protein [Deltaproteobacteria bacterium]